MKESKFLAILVLLLLIVPTYQLLSGLLYEIDTGLRLLKINPFQFCMDILRLIFYTINFLVVLDFLLFYNRKIYSIYYYIAIAPFALLIVSMLQTNFSIDQIVTFIYPEACLSLLLCSAYFIVRRFYN